MTLSRDPVVWAGAISGLVAAAVAIGAINADQAASVNGVVQALVGAAAFLLPLISSLIARAKVTPLAHAQDNEGRRLVPAGDGHGR